MTWKSIETLPEDNEEIVEILMSGGQIVQAPNVDYEPVPRGIKAKLAEMGHWPNHKDFTPTHWRRINRTSGD